MRRCVFPRILKQRLGREQSLKIDALGIVRQLQTILHEQTKFDLIINCIYSGLQIKFVIRMNFFDDDFGLGSTPLYTKKPSYSGDQKRNINADQLSRKSGKKDQFDDLLDDLLNKQQKRSNKKKQRETVQPYSSAYLDPPSHNMDFKKTEKQKWSTPNIEFDQFQSPKFPLGKHTSIMDDRASDDGRSYKSGFTGFTNKQNNLQFDNLITLRGDTKDQAPIVERSSRQMMKPPLRKKDSRDNLAKDQTSIWDQQPPQFNNIPRRNQSPEQMNLDLISNKETKAKSQIVVPDSKEKTEEKIKERIIQKQKIITVRQQATQLKKQFQNQIKQIKQSYQRQISLNQQRLKNEIEQHKKTKNTLTKQYEQKLSEERNKWQQLMNQNTERLKQMHEWQLRKKSEAYQMQIERIKSLSKFQENILKNQNNLHTAQESFEIKAKQRELQSEKMRLEQLKYHLQQRQKNLESQQYQFAQYKRRQQQKIQTQRRALYQKQNQIKKNELQSKRNIALQKQQIASDLAQSQLEIYRKKQAINLERQELKSLRQMIEKEKSQFQAFNNNILNDYKMKMKEVETQKQHLNDLQIEIHKNLHFLQMTGQQLKATTTQGKSFQRPSTASNIQNHRNRSNTQLSNKLNETKGRFKEMQNFAKTINQETQLQRQKIKQKINLSGYINRVNRALSKF